MPMTRPVPILQTFPYFSQFYRCYLQAMDIGQCAGQAKTASRRMAAAKELEKGLGLYQATYPIGVIGVVFESRPYALVQIASLCLKSGNAVLLRGGSEAAGTNRILADIIDDAGTQARLPAGWLTLLETRADVTAMLALDGDFSLIQPAHVRSATV